jgi:hypothetical protein
LGADTLALLKGLLNWYPPPYRRLHLHVDAEAAAIPDPHAMSAAHTNKTLQVEWIDPDSFYLYLYLCLFLTLLSVLLIGNVHSQKILTLKCFLEIFPGLVVFMYKLM